MSLINESKKSFSQTKNENNNKKVFNYFNLAFCYSFKLFNSFIEKHYPEI